MQDRAFPAFLDHCYYPQPQQQPRLNWRFAY